MRCGLRTNNCWVFVWKVNLWSCSWSYAHVLTLMSHDHGCQLSFTTFFFDDETDTLRRSCCCSELTSKQVLSSLIHWRVGYSYIYYIGVNGLLEVKVKVWTLAIAQLTRVRLVTSSALRSRKWQLIGMSYWCRSALCGHLLPALTDNWTHDAASRLGVKP